MPFLMPDEIIQGDDNDGHRKGDTLPGSVQYNQNGIGKQESTSVELRSLSSSSTPVEIAEQVYQLRSSAANIPTRESSPPLNEVESTRSQEVSDKIAVMDHQSSNTTSSHFEVGRLPMHAWDTSDSPTPLTPASSSSPTLLTTASIGEDLNTRDSILLQPSSLPITSTTKSTRSSSSALSYPSHPPTSAPPNDGPGGSPSSAEPTRLQVALQQRAGIKTGTSARLSPRTVNVSTTKVLSSKKKIAPPLPMTKQYTMNRMSSSEMPAERSNHNRRRSSALVTPLGTVTITVSDSVKRTMARRALHFLLACFIYTAYALLWTHEPIACEFQVCWSVDYDSSCSCTPGTWRSFKSTIRRATSELLPALQCAKLICLCAGAPSGFPLTVLYICAALSYCLALFLGLEDQNARFILMAVTYSFLLARLAVLHRPTFRQKVSRTLPVICFLAVYNAQEYFIWFGMMPAYSKIFAEGSATGSSTSGGGVSSSSVLGVEGNNGSFASSGSGSFTSSSSSSILRFPLTPAPTTIEEEGVFASLKASRFDSTYVLFALPILLMICGKLWVFSATLWQFSDHLSLDEYHLMGVMVVTSYVKVVRFVPWVAYKDDQLPHSALMSMAMSLALDLTTRYDLVGTVYHFVRKRVYMHLLRRHPPHYNRSRLSSMIALTSPITRYAPWFALVVCNVLDKSPADNASALCSGIPLSPELNFIKTPDKVWIIPVGILSEALVDVLFELKASQRSSILLALRKKADVIFYEPKDTVFGVFVHVGGIMRSMMYLEGLPYSMLICDQNGMPPEVCAAP